MLPLCHRSCSGFSILQYCQGSPIQPQSSGVLAADSAQTRLGLEAHTCPAQVQAGQYCPFQGGDADQAHSFCSFLQLWHQIHGIGSCFLEVQRKPHRKPLRVRVPTRALMYLRAPLGTIFREDCGEDVEVRPTEARTGNLRRVCPFDFPNLEKIENGNPEWTHPRFFDRHVDNDSCKNCST